MVVNFSFSGPVEVARPEVRGGLQWHMAAVAIGLGLFRIVEAGDSNAGNAAEVEGIVVILASQPFVTIERLWQVDFVTSTTEFRTAMEWLEESLFVKIRFGFDQLPVDPAEGLVLTKGKGVVDRLFDGVVGIAAGSIDMSDSVTRGTSDAGVGHGILSQVVIR